VKPLRYLVGLIVALALLAGGFTAAPASANADPYHEPKPKKEQPAPAEEDEPAVVIDGGTVTSETVIDISADGGTAISDASGGDENFAFANAGGEGAGDDEDEGRGGVLGLRDELLGGGDDAGAAGDTAAAGNGGTADASANGGAVAIGDINSGGNSGNTITVGDTNVAPAPAPEKPKPVAPEKPVAPKPVAPKPVAPDAGKKVDDGGKNGGNGDAAPRARGGERVRGLPSTGVGVAGEAGSGAALLLVVGALGAAGYAARRRFA